MKRQSQHNYIYALNIGANIPPHDYSTVIFRSNQRQLLLVEFITYTAVIGASILTIKIPRASTHP